MNAVGSLQSALRQYTSDKVKERAQANATIREILGNPENVDAFHDVASRAGGEGWIAFMQSLFAPVGAERRTVLRKGGSLADRRLADAVSLVRWVTERNAHLFSRRAFVVVFTHMTAALVHEGAIFEPAVIDYAKALRALLSYPPHLASLDGGACRSLINICFAAVLGDRVEEDADADASGESAPPLPTFLATEVVALLPIVLGCPFDVRTGLDVLDKLHRCLATQHAVSLDILRALNIVLAELELNCRVQFAGMADKLFPHLVALFAPRAKNEHREHVLIALRTILPFVDQADVGSLLDLLPKEATNRGIRPLDLACLRLGNLRDGPFAVAGMSAGPGFDAAHATTWAALELYADCCFRTHDAVPATPDRSKRQRRDSPLALILSSPTVLGVQMLVFLVNRHYAAMQAEAQTMIRTHLVDMLDNDALQPWAFIALSSLAVLDPSSGPWDRVWAHAVRKSVGADSRAACHAVTTLLPLVDTAVSDVAGLLKTIDIQGPAYPHEAACELVALALEHVRSDVTLYTSNLEDKVVGWVEKTFDYKRARPSAAPAGLLRTFAAICGFQSDIADASVLDHLPSCPIVDRVLDERRTAPIRQFILRGDIPAAAVVEHRIFPPVADVLTGLDGRPAALSHLLRSQLAAAVAESGRLGVERVQQHADLVVLAVLFQATLEYHGVHPDVDCLVAAGALLDAILARLPPVQSARGIWRAFIPLVQPRDRHETTWPILLKPDEASGIRLSILSPAKYASTGSSASENPVLSLVWSRTETAGSLHSLVAASRAALDALPPTKPDDDDFGPVVPNDDKSIGDKDYTGYYRTLVTVRLRGPMLRDARPARDNPLINAFVESEGGRFVQLGIVVCDAASSGLLRLLPDATELILDELRDRLGAYRYMRDEGMLLLCIAFLRCSADIWLSPDSDLTEPAVHLFKVMVNRVREAREASQKREKFVPWRVRLALLQLIDDYIDYDHDVWGDDGLGGPMAYVMHSTADPDARVRFRAATSAAGLHYVASLDATAKSAVYLDVIQTQTGDSAQWDRFLTDLLWKLNTCVASAQLRAATIFHLYEIGDFAPAFARHLQRGLEAVADRLGLASLAELYFAYANIVVDNQLLAGQQPLRLPPRLYGCASRQEYAARCLDVVGAKVLANHDAHATFFAALCEAAGVAHEHAIRTHLAAAAAITFAEAYRDAQGDRAAEASAAIDMVRQLPAPAGADAYALVTANVDLVLSHLFMLLSHDASTADIAALLSGEQRKVFRLLATASLDDASVPALDPSAPAHAVLLAREQLQQLPLSSRKVLFDALVRLFDAAHATFLVSEQARVLRAVALVSSLYFQSFTHGPVMHLFLQGTIGLLNEGGAGSSETDLVVFRMVAWVIDLIVNSKRTPQHLEDLLIQFGKVYEKVAAGQGDSRLLADAMKAYVDTHAAKWQASESFSSALHVAVAFWPSALAEPFGSIGIDLDTVATMPRTAPMTLCRRLEVAPQDIPTFLDSTFWYLRQRLDDYDPDGAMSFLDLLYRADGRIRAPSLAAITGLTRRPAQSSKANAKAAILEQLILYTHNADHRLRAAAYAALRATVADRTLPAGFGELAQFLAVTEPPPVPAAVALDDIDTRPRPFNEWCTGLAGILNAAIANDDPFYSSLQPLVAHCTVASDLLPHLVQAALTDDAKRAPTLSAYFSNVLVHGDAKTTEAIINVVLHLRNFACPHVKGVLSYDHWLEIDHLLLSEAAGRCGAFASSLLFLEMSETAVDLSEPRVQKVLYDIYSNVEDPDGFYGVPNSNVMDSLLRRLAHERQPAHALGYHAANYEAARTAGALQPAIRNLHDLGFISMAGTLGRAAHDGGAPDLDLAWKMADWDVPVPVASSSSARMYTALRAVHREREPEAARRIVDGAIRGEVAHLRELGGERMEQIKQTAANLVCLRDVARWVSKPVQKALEENDFGGALLGDFVKLSDEFEFDVAERLVATRVSLIRAGRERESKHLFGDLTSTQSEGLVSLERSSQLRLSELARRNGNLQVAVNAIAAVEHLDSARSNWAQDELCRVLWAHGEHALAIQRLEQMRMDGDRRGAVLRGRKAQWLSLARVKPPAEIMATFNAAWALAESHCDANEQARIAHDYAVFCDHQYARLRASPELERLRALDVRAAVLAQSQAHRRVAERDEAELNADKEAKRKLDDELLACLTTALEMYAAALALVDDYDDSVTRLCSVWLQHDADDAANKAFARALPDIPTHKFVFLAPQLAARLHAATSKRPLAFTAALNDLVFRLAQQHPYHVLYQIITLAYGVNKHTTAEQNPRGYEAARVLARLESGNAPLAKHAVRGMRHFADAAIKWCYWGMDDKHSKANYAGGKEYKLPSNCTLRGCTDLGIPIATAPPPIDRTGRYDNIVTLVRYASSFSVAGGVHQPSINRCVDSAGGTHTQLGDDEVRQDAVMEQVFEMTNGLLRRDRKAAARNLRFRTYNVIPLANKTGIIEFVGGTMSIGDWLKDAHVRYRKTVDVSANTIRVKLKEVQDRDPLSPELVRIYKQYMANFQPVMRHFFTERNREPLAWFATRLNYARSVAVASIVGYMVGLGDRHCSNILIDTQTGEHVHIDFGIVFEGGNALRIPERVPFRLTNDVVDGLGITGVEGAFRQCSQHTLRVLRDSSGLILTVLEVFKNDPLYAWEADPNKMRRAQNGKKADAAAHTSTAPVAGIDRADRILARVRQKLGHELSVEYAVNQLIQEARDTENLAKIFVGWQSWL